MKKDVPRFIARLPGSLAAVFALKDFLVFLLFAGREPSVLNKFFARMGFLPGSLLFDGFVIWGAFAFNILFGAFIGWVILEVWRRRLK